MDTTNAFDFTRKRRELTAYFRALTANKIKYVNQNKFVMFGQGRTGSQLLSKLLNCHPKINVDPEKEILHYRVLNPMQYIKGRCLKFSGDKFYGFFVKIYELTEVQRLNNTANFLSTLHSQNWQIIYLKRNNTFRQSLSTIVAAQRGKYHFESGEKIENYKVKIDFDILFKTLSDREKFLLEEQKALANLPYLSIIYENDLLNEEAHTRTADRIFNYLGLDSHPVSTKLIRTTSDHLSDFIENYDELVEIISKTKYAKFLESE